MLLRTLLAFLVDRVGLIVFNKTLAEIFHHRSELAANHDDIKQAQFLDAISEGYDTLNDTIDTWPFRDQKPS